MMLFPKKDFAMKSVNRLFLVMCVLLFTLTNCPAQTETIKKRWDFVADKMPDEWYGSQEAIKIAENILLYQRNIGGWPKNIEMHHPLNEEQMQTITKEKNEEDAIFDNGATTTEMKFLAKVYAKHPDERYQKAFVKGLDFILMAQYPDNGGWPMFYPLKKQGYYDRITFNDDAIVNLLRMLKSIWNKDSEMSAILSQETVMKSRSAYDKGIQCILDCQIRKNGIKTVWCAQHDENDLKPAYGRPYEHPSFSGGESVEIVRFLMEIEEPSQEIQDAVHAAVAWLDSHRIKGIKVVYFTNAEGERDCRVEKDTTAPDLWARFYHLEKEVPLFGDYKTPSEILYNMSDIIVTSRRTGYKWYGDWAEKLIKTEYPKWKEGLK